LLLFYFLIKAIWAIASCRFILGNREGSWLLHTPARIFPGSYSAKEFYVTADTLTHLGLVVFTHKRLLIVPDIFNYLLEKTQVSGKN